jgi:nicotinamide/nicotinate riboside kinase
LNEQKEVPVPDEVGVRWRAIFEELKHAKEAEGERIVWGLVDGFLLYWNQVSVRIY